MIKIFKSREFITFLVIGSFASFVNLLSRLFYNQYISFGNAVILSSITGMIIGFILYKIFVFKRSMHSTFKEIYLFLLVNLFTIIQTYFISIGLEKYFFPYIEFSFYPTFIAHVCGVGFPTLSSFLGHKFVTFKNT